MKSLVPFVCATTAIAACDASAPTVEPVAAAYGVMQVRFIDNRVVRDSAYPLGTYDVPLDADRAMAFDNDSVRTTICSRTSNKSFELNGNLKYWRFQCDTTWNSRGVLFVADTTLVLKRGELLDWKKLEGQPLTRPASASADSLHSYAQLSTPALLGGKVLVNAAWFTGEYPPRKEMDVLRGDSMTFGHYRILDRVLFIGASPLKPSTYMLRTNEPLDVSGPLEWAFFPDDASEKNESKFHTIWETPKGYLIRVFQWHDHEGFGVDEFTNLYRYETGRWQILVKAERFRAY